MEDKELIELAAKAAGFNFRWFKVKQWKNMRGRIGPYRHFTGTVDVYGSHHTKPWNPLTDDGDALRLAVKLGMGISFGQYAPLDVYSVYISKVEHGDEIAVGCITDGDEFGVVRRAIVRAAAQIGREME